jgi:4'-phosphopantetheinyl transferase EntD
MTTGLTTDVATAALDVVRNTLAAEPHETIAQAALRRIEEFLATPTYARRELVTQTMVALTLGVSGADDSPSWARVFAAAQLARRLPCPCALCG